MALLDPGLDNSVGSNWVEATEPYGDGDSGTPGSPNFITSLTLEIDHQPDWNLVGLPLNVEDNNYLAVFPDAVENTLFSFDEAYVHDSTLIQRKGYWLRFASEGTTPVTGFPIIELSISLIDGWNLVSGLDEAMSVYSFITLTVQ